MASEATTSPPLGAHERGKSKRRRAILDAARDIILREGEAGMTMRSMAALAGVSPATPYNLFGSKQAILLAIYDEDYDNFARYFDSHASRDPLNRIIDLAEVSVEYFDLQPDFFRALFAILQRNSGSEVDSLSWSKRQAYLRGLIQACVTSGEMRPDTPVALVASALLRIFKAIFQEWVEGSLTLRGAGDELGASIALVLASLVTERGAPALDLARARYGPRA